MPVLKNAKWESFAQGLAEGLAVGDAYVNAGYKDSPASATRLSKNVKIQARVDELVAKGADRAEATVERVLKEMARLGFGDIRKAFTAGDAILPPSQWDDDFAASVAAIEVVSKPTGEKDEEGRPVVEHVHKIKLWDKNSALEKLAKHLGMFIERHEHTGKDGGPLALIVSKEDAEL
ncbi:terminase small subunit [Martelella lutilitoris]|uniref:Terminase small subunit n=1 Tax=Martelella lutilitoris TaxID=2583532 RepID=A0A7T7HHP7_9HYPH|nr:terminase small subunit [Martelella lutilitoris]QQM29308.1 terminase small subunit [Martelella lutilitoris]